ncbi:3-phosphoglycerate kinase, partial [Tanacetum coccineum]
ISMSTMLLELHTQAHDSTEGVTKFLKPYVAGFLFPKELDYLDGAVSNPKRPFATIVVGPFNEYSRCKIG